MTVEIATMNVGIAKVEGFAESVATSAARDATRSAQISFYLGGIAATLHMMKRIPAMTKAEALTEAAKQVEHFENILENLGVTGVLPR